MTYKLYKESGVYRLFIYIKPRALPVIYETDCLEDVFKEIEEWEKYNR